MKMIYKNILLISQWIVWYYMIPESSAYKSSLFLTTADMSKIKECLIYFRTDNAIFPYLGILAVFMIYTF